MKKSIKLWSFFAFAFTVFAGTLLHFLYDFSGKAIWAALFSGVNESTWEHMKLIFFPMLFFAFVQSFFFKGAQSYWCIKRNGILIALFMIPFLFYMYNGVIGKSPDLVNIAIFFASAALAYIYEARAFNKGSVKCRSPRIALVTLLFIAALFIVFTFATPPLAIFIDPTTGLTGIN